MNPLSGQKRFLRDEFHRLTLSATVQRAQVYAPGTAEQSRLPFQKGLQRELEVLHLRYAEPVAEFEHRENIRAIAASLTAQYSSVLRDGRFRIGPAQKALNLFLKYLWCVKQIQLPPHCPF